MKTYAIILAAGSSKRFGEDFPKQFLKIQNKTILEYSIDAFENNENITDIIVITNPDYMNLTKEIINDKYTKIRAIKNGGKTRQESSYIAILDIQDKEANILIHDGARPFVSQEIISNCINELKRFDAVAVAIPSNDTIIKIDRNNFITEIPNREDLRRIQTPQCFKLNIIKQAHKLAQNDKSFMVTDDCGLVMHYNLAKIKIITGDEKNLKITYKTDLKNI